MKQSLPWESVPPPIYTARALKPRKKWVTVGGWILVVVLLIGGLVTKYKIALLFALLYLVTMMSKRDAVVTTRGLEIYHQMQITTHYDFWGWDEINSIVRELRNHPELVQLHIGIGAKEKALFFTKADSEAIMKLAKEKNPAIRILDSTGVPAPQQRKKKK